MEDISKFIEELKKNSKALEGLTKAMSGLKGDDIRKLAVEMSKASSESIKQKKAIQDQTDQMGEMTDAIIDQRKANPVGALNSAHAWATKKNQYADVNKARMEYTGIKIFQNSLYGASNAVGALTYALVTPLAALKFLGYHLDRYIGLQSNLFYTGVVFQNSLAGLADAAYKMHIPMEEMSKLLEENAKALGNKDLYEYMTAFTEVIDGTGESFSKFSEKYGYNLLQSAEQMGTFAEQMRLSGRSSKLSAIEIQKEMKQRTTTARDWAKISKISMDTILAASKELYARMDVQIASRWLNQTFGGGAAKSFQSLMYNIAGIDSQPIKDAFVDMAKSVIPQASETFSMLMSVGAADMAASMVSITEKIKRGVEPSQNDLIRVAELATDKNLQFLNILAQNGDATARNALELITEFQKLKELEVKEKSNSLSSDERLALNTMRARAGIQNVFIKLRGIFDKFIAQVFTEENVDIMTKFVNSFVDELAVYIEKFIKLTTLPGNASLGEMIKAGIGIVTDEMTSVILKTAGAFVGITAAAMLLTNVLTASIKKLSEFALGKVFGGGFSSLPKGAGMDYGGNIGDGRKSVLGGMTAGAGAGIKSIGAALASLGKQPQILLGATYLAGAFTIIAAGVGAGLAAFTKILELAGTGDSMKKVLAPITELNGEALTSAAKGIASMSGALALFAGSQFFGMLGDLGTKIGGLLGLSTPLQQISEISKTIDSEAISRSAASFERFSASLITTNAALKAFDIDKFSRIKTESEAGTLSKIKGAFDRGMGYLGFGDEETKKTERKVNQEQIKAAESDLTLGEINKTLIEIKSYLAQIQNVGEGSLSELTKIRTAPKNGDMNW